MYIISKFNDYYDGAVGMGIDKTIIYQRHLKAMSIPEHIRKTIDEDHGWNSSFTDRYSDKIPKGRYNTSIIVVGFCGKLYLGLKCTKQIWGRNEFDVYTDLYKTHITYDLERIREIIKQYDKDRKGYEKKWYKSKSELFENYLLRFNAIDPTEWFRELNTPIFVWGTPKDIDRWRYIDQDLDKNNFFVNASLKDYEFAKVIDPYTAFQEVYMYIGGVLGVNKDGTEIPATEKQKVAQHGMDKWSFRKPPNK